jgi:hypothetical protein
MKKSYVPWIIAGVVAAFFCTPLSVIPALLYGVFFYPKQFPQNMVQGKPVVEAVYRYRDETGLYPATLDELIPAYITAIPAGWGYSPPSDGRPAKLVFHGAFHSFLTYYFARPSGSQLPPETDPEGWEYNQEGTYHFQGRDRVPVPLSTKTKDEIIALRLKELHRRVDAGKQDSSRPEAFKRLISELVRLGRFDEAATACRQCGAETDGQWCRMALAELDLRRDSTVGLDEFTAWVKRSPSFPRYYALAYLHRQHGKTADALAALREAAKYPLHAKDELPFSPEYFGYDSALFAYRNSQHDLALSICDAWEHYVKSHGYGDRSFHAVRAAAYLATDRQPAAAREVAHALEAYREHRTWADNLAPLEQAVEAGDRKFVYKPGQFWPEYRLFLDEVE